MTGEHQLRIQDTCRYRGHYYPRATRCREIREVKETRDAYENRNSPGGVEYAVDKAAEAALPPALPPEVIIYQVRRAQCLPSSGHGGCSVDREFKAKSVRCGENWTLRTSRSTPSVGTCMFFSKMSLSRITADVLEEVRTCAPSWSK
jgi:hypothetical protein